MSLNYEGGKTWPYPTRSVELVEGWKKEDFEKRLVLNEVERSVLGELENGLYESLNGIKKMKVEKDKTDYEEVASRRFELEKHYWESHGDLTNYSEPERKRKNVDDESLLKKVSEYRKFKGRIKDLLRETNSGEETDLVVAASIILEIYKRYVNVKIAEDIILDGWSPRKTERVDKFVNGVFPEFDENGDFVVLGKVLEDRVEEIEKNNVSDYEFPNVWVDEDDAEILADYLFKKLNFSEWKVVRRKTDKTSMAINTKDKKINIGKEMRIRVEDFLPVLAHEIEGHAANAEFGGKALKIMDRYSAGGRSSIMTEMLGKWVEQKTRQKMDLQPKEPETLYFRILEMKKKGATFYECFDYYFRKYAEKKGYDVKSVFGNLQEYTEIFDYTYDRVMRIFRRRGSLSDRYSHLTISSQLKYLEQSLVLEKVVELGIEKIMFKDGMDLFAVKDLFALGIFDDIHEERCSFVVAKGIWPVIKKGLNDGKGIKDILAEMKMG